MKTPTFLKFAQHLNFMAVLAGIACVSSASAQALKTWTGGNGDFFDPAHWDAGTPPGATDTALINNGSTATIAANSGAHDLGAFRLGGAGDGTVVGTTEFGHIIMNGGTLTLGANAGDSKGVIGLSPVLSTFIMNGGTILFDGPDLFPGDNHHAGVNNLDWEVGEKGLGRFEMHNNAIFRFGDDLKIAENAAGSGSCLIDGTAVATIGSGISISSGGSVEQTMTIAGNARVDVGNSMGAGSPQGSTDEGYLTMAIGGGHASLTIQDNAILNIRRLSAREGVSVITVKNHGQFHIFDVFSGKGGSVNPPDRPAENEFNSSYGTAGTSEATLTLQDDAIMTVNAGQAQTEDPHSGLAIGGRRAGGDAGGLATLTVQGRASFRVEQDLAIGDGSADTSRGTLTVRGPDATVSIRGDLNLAYHAPTTEVTPGTGVLNSVITSSTHSTVNVVGKARIGNGTLKVKLDGYTPSGGEVYTLITADSIEGEFLHTDFSEAPVASGFSWRVDYKANSVELSLTFAPGGVASVGLTHVVPDMLVWYNSHQLPGQPFAGYATNGPVDKAAQVDVTALNNGNWEPYASVVSDNTFLVGAGMFADDGSWAGSTNLMGGTRPNQRYVVMLQPAAGGSPKIGEVFYDDFGQPYRLHAMQRQRNPGVRVAGDKRLGATNFIAGGTAALLYGKFWFGIDYFNTDGRYSTNFPLYGTGFGSLCNQDCSGTPPGTTDFQSVSVQTFGLNPSTLAQTPLTKAFDSTYGLSWRNQVPIQFCNKAGLPCGNGGAASDNQSYFGGELAALDNGNFVSVVNDYTGFLEPTRLGQPAAVATILKPDGTIVKDTWLVDPREIWSNVAAYRGGFCVRVQTLFYFYDNAGNPIATNTVASSGVGYDTGRGDGARIASDIRSHYVYLATPIAVPGGVGVGLGIWDARTGAFVTNAIVSSDLDPNAMSRDRVGLAVDALDRICVAYNGKTDKTAAFQDQIIARVMKFDGTKVTFLTQSFFPFASSDTNAANILGYKSTNPNVAMTTRQICIAGKGILNSTNNPAGGPDITAETTLYTVISHPDPQPTPGAEGIAITSITASGPAVTITWTGGTGPYLLQKKASLNDAAWQNVLTTPDKSASVALQGNAAFFRLVDGAQITVTSLTAFLNGGAEQPTANASTATGLGSFSLEGNTLTYFITFSGLSANASAAHIHGPTNTTGAVGVIIPFSPPAATAGVISGSVTVTDQQKTWLLSGLTYANIHNATFPGGEIRGQIGPTQLKATLNGANERPTPVVTGGTGSAALTRIGNRLLFNITYSGLTSAGTAAHIHGRADTSIAAGVLTPLPTPTGTAGTLSGALTLDNPTLAAIVDGLSYVNIHTVNFGGGEIRGQITP